MELGTRIKQARLEKGLTQRQLCGEYMTRNMLSLLENGSAKPSVETLEYLAKALGKPVGYFLGEASPLDDARSALALGDLDGLRQALDGAEDSEEGRLLEFYWHLAAAEKALEDGREAYAQTLLGRALEISGVYVTKQLTQRARVLLTLAGGRGNPGPVDEDLLALAIQARDLRRRREILGAAEDQTDPRWRWEMARAEMELGDFAGALGYLEGCGEGREVWEARERCCRELGDFKGAYEAACKLR